VLSWGVFPKAARAGNTTEGLSKAWWDLSPGAALDQLGQRLLDVNRTIGQPKKITTIFGRKVTKHYKGKLQTIIEDL
jgi:hypothetical protein